MTDFLEVKAKRTFPVGKELKTKKSDPFKVEAGEAKQLAAQGLVDIVGEAKVEATAEDDVAVEDDNSSDGDAAVAVEPTNGDAPADTVSEPPEQVTETLSTDAPATDGETEPDAKPSKRNKKEKPDAVNEGS
ncbi:hypothetical protein [Rhizobium rhizogenes]|uniref:hypothetical protein n=1 Tax=Rhizobium rhizogenes TaxID=359 RepID=UPI00286981C8|nr:hypothetical protein [Rhizobium rhizogenes]